MVQQTTLENNNSSTKVNVINVELDQPHSGQQRILDSKARFKVLMAGRRWGKSLISQHKSITTILSPNRYVAYVTPTYALSKVFFRDVLKILPKEVIKSCNQSDLIIELINGSSLTFLTGEKPDNFRGLKFHLVIIDEASYVKDLKNSWELAIRPTLTDFKGDCIFISTPNGKDYFDSLYTKGLDPLQTDWESFRFTSYDNPHIEDSEIDIAKSELPESAFKQEYLAIPSENANNPFGTKTIKDSIISKLSNKPTTIFGIDLAKSSDYSVIIGLDEDGNMSYYDRFQFDWARTKDKIRSLPRTVVKHIDSTGVGDVIYEELNREMSNLIGFKFTAQSKPQLILSLIKNMELGNIGVYSEVEDELMSFEYKITSTGHTKYEAKAGYNDDKVIALALANYLHKKRSGAGRWAISTARKF